MDRDGNGFLDMSELKAALDIVGFKIPQWKVRQMIDEIERKRAMEKRGRLDYDEFQQLCADLKAQDVAVTFKTMVSKRENLETLGGMSEASSEGTTHSVRHEEQVAFSDWINTYVYMFIRLFHKNNNKKTILLQ